MAVSINFPSEKCFLDAGGICHRQADVADFHMPIIEWGAKIGNTFKKLVKLINIDRCIFPFACAGIA